MAHRNLFASKNLDVAGTSHDPESGSIKGIQGELAPAPYLSSLCASAAQPDQQPEHRRQRDTALAAPNTSRSRKRPTSSRRSSLQN